MRVALVVFHSTAAWQPMIGDNHLELRKAEDVIVVRPRLEGKAELGTDIR